MPRIPIFRVLRKSPFDGLLEHASKVRECLSTLKEAIVTYSEGKYEESQKLSDRVVALEHEADLIKNKVLMSLPRGILLPVEKSEFIRLLIEQDAILNSAEDAVIWMNMRKTKIPKEIKEDFLRHLYKVLECTDALEKVVINVKKLVTATLSRKLRETTEKIIQEVHKKEYEDDTIEKELAKKIFALPSDPLSVFHLLKLSDLIGDIATHAENAGDRISAMIAR